MSLALVIGCRDFRNLPDFEQIYHLVIDAVDTYNERWEKECKRQEAERLDRERQAAQEQQQEEAERAKMIKNTVSYCRNMKGTENNFWNTERFKGCCPCRGGCP